ncbi:hypothetical protein VTJ49DRAFT_1039 [Mycothermus thermophilus]|uniref:Arylamine N-acetyltransferase n=1 Tax=Humicola insolens TaxID=85995 RepID=A0ABR3VDF2_HUMIN
MPQDVGSVGKALRALSKFPTLRVVELLGQLCISEALFYALTVSDDDDSDLGEANTFPALTHFTLHIGPDTADGTWFFEADKTGRPEERAEKTTEGQRLLELMDRGLLPAFAVKDRRPLPEDPEYQMWVWSRDLDYGHLEPESVERFRTLPCNDTINSMMYHAARAVARMPKIERFEVSLKDNFTADNREYPFSPPYLSRKFGMFYSRERGEKERSILTLELGAVVDYWRPAEDVIDEWRDTAKEHGVEELEVEYRE